MAYCRSLLSGFLALAALSSISVSSADAQDKTTPGGSDVEFTSWLSALKSDGVDVTNTGISYDAAADRLTVKGMKLTFGAATGNAEGGVPSSPATLTLDSLELAGFSTSADGIAFKSAAVQGVSLDGASWAGAAMTASRLGLQDVFLPSLKAFVADPKRPISSQVTLLRLLSTARAAVVTVEDFKTGEGVSIGAVQVSSIAGGAAERVELTGAVSLQASEDGNAAGQVRLAAGSVVVSKVDLDPYLRLFEEDAYLEAGAARPWRNLIEKVVVNGFEFEGGGTKFTSDAVTLDAMKVRQFPEDITDLFDQAAVDRAFLSANPDAAAKFTTTIRNAFAVDAVAVGPSKILTKNEGGAVEVTAASARISGLSANRIEAIALEKLGYVDSVRSLNADTLQLGGINVPQRMGSTSEASATSPIPQVSVVKLAGFEGTVGDAKFGISQFDLDMSYFVKGTPTKVTMALSNLKMGVGQIAIPGIRDTLTAFGYQDVDLSMELNGSWQERSSEIAVENVALSVAGLGKLSASGSLTGVTRAGIEDPAARLSSEISAGGLKNFRLSFENEAFFQKFVAEVAKQNGRTVDEIKKALAANMPAIMASVFPAAIKNKLIFAGVSFVNDPRSLDFVAGTADVVAWKDIVAALPTPALLPGLLQLDVRANGSR
jgi:hypothetical protein